MMTNKKISNTVCYFRHARDKNVLAIEMMQLIQQRQKPSH